MIETLKKLCVDTKELVVVWGIDAVLELRPDLTNDEAWLVLQAIAANCSTLVCIDVNYVKSVADERYPAETIPKQLHKLMTERQLILIIAGICNYAQECTSSNKEADRSQLSVQMWNVSYVVACYLSQHTKQGIGGVGCDVVLKELCGLRLAEQEWVERATSLVKELNYERGE